MNESQTIQSIQANCVLLKYICGTSRIIRKSVMMKKKWFTTLSKTNRLTDWLNIIINICVTYGFV